MAADPHTQTSPRADIYALVPCAGIGARSGASGPKQYAMLAGRSVIAHTLAALSAVTRIGTIMVVLSPDDSLFDQHRGEVDCVAVRRGGATRAQTVRNGLGELLAHGARREDWVLVHDAARCLVTPELIDKLIDACQGDEVGGLLAHKLPDTLKRDEGGRASETLDRDDKWAAQTPQMFRIGMLRQALEGAGDNVTDESSAIESMGLKPLLVEAGGQNFKVTYPEDFAAAEIVLKGRSR